MKHGSLFSGIGGFDLAAESMGWENVFHCEWMPFPRKVLSHYWPQATSYHDITTTDFTVHRGQIDILTGGFPCQPYSAAGKRKGKDDDRHLWPHMLRCIREVRPRWVVGENVFGLVTWNAGMVFEEVCANLESEGYSVQPFVLPAAAVNAPHRRDRVWFVAYAKNNGRDGGEYKQWENTTISERGIQQCEDQGRDEIWEQFERLGQSRAATNPSSAVSPRECEYGSRQIQPHGRNSGAIQTNFEDFPTQPPICSGDDGLPHELDGITFPKWRAESIKGYGNAIVPQVASQIFRAIEQYEQQ